MAVVAGFDVHGARITFDVLDRGRGEVHRGRMRATPEAVREWAGRFPGEEIHVAVEAGTGWLFVCEALVAAGAIPHLGEPVETSALRGRKRRARTDREDARLAADAAVRGPSAGGLDPARTRARVAHPRAARQDAGRRARGLAAASPGNAVSPRHRGCAGQAAERSGPRLPRRARAARRGQRADRGVAPDDRGARPPARPAGARVAPTGPPPKRLPGLMAHYGIGELTAPTILCELGDVTRLSASRKAVRCAGLDVGVHRSDRRSRAGKLTRQGSPQLRWAL